MSTAYDTSPRLALISALISTSDRRMPPGDAASISTQHHEGMLITPGVHPDNGMTADDIAYVHDNGESDGRRRACLLANNGLVVGADTPADAVRIGQQIELMCDQYLRACSVGIPVELASNELS